LDIYTYVRLLLSFLAAAAVSLADNSAQTAHTQARLLLAADSARGGDAVMAGIALRMDANWHTYWSNPGQSGGATIIDWQLPAGVSAGPIQWPVPEKLVDGELTTYIYEDEVVLLVPLKLAADLRQGPLDLKAKVSWLECGGEKGKEKCVQESASVQATLNAGPEKKPSENAPLLAAWQKKLPQNGERLGAHAFWEKAAKADLRPLILEWPSPAPAATEADFFPDASDQFEVQPITERLPSDAGKIRLRAQVKKLLGDWPDRISGLLIQKSGTERQAYAVNLPVGASGPTAAAVDGSGPVAGVVKQSLWLNLLYAFLGGLILNVMPCVLPVIALKILGFVQQAKDEPAQVRKLGLIYTAGVLVSFLALALVIIGLKAAGSKVGWGFQFNNPYFLVAMTTLVTLIALNLFGVFEVTLGSRTLTAATSLSSKHGSAGAFFNGLLATLLATSCSAPILGAAIGFAFAQPAGIILLIILTVGLGLAAPYLVLSWQPAWLKFLPKPGAWMEKFKIAMGFPMLAAAVWLCSILTLHYGERTWWLAIFLVFVAVASWIYGEFVQRGSKHRVTTALATAAVLFIGYRYALEGELRWREPIRETKESSTAALPKVAPRGLDWQKWSPEAVAAARAEGRPVVVDFTATWCPTCNTVVKPSFESASVRSKIKEVNAVTLLADYSRQPEDIGAELDRFGRRAVPLVVVYPRNAQEPPKAYDWVTPGILVDALEKAAL
jgi:thiol:disulfide interchange protein DsbD